MARPDSLVDLKNVPAIQFEHVIQIKTMWKFDHLGETQKFGRNSRPCTPS